MFCALKCVEDESSGIRRVDTPKGSRAYLPTGGYLKGASTRFASN
jgi:hypothetical protein